MDEQHTSKVPDLYLEQYRLGELPSALLGRVSAYVETPEGKARMEALEASNHAVLTAHPAPVMAASIAQRRDAAKGSSVRALVWSVAAAAAALVLVVWALWNRQPQPPPGSEPTAQARVEIPAPDAEEVLRAKGGPHLLIHRKQGAHPEPLAEGALIQAGDLLQVSYLSAGVGFGVIISIDGRGSVTLHHPSQTQASTALSPSGQAVGLAHAYLLDDAPSFERFILVTSSEPLDVNRVLESAASLAKDPESAPKAPLELPDEWQQSSVLLLKTNF